MMICRQTDGEMKFMVALWHISGVNKFFTEYQGHVLANVRALQYYMYMHVYFVKWLDN